MAPPQEECVYLVGCATSLLGLLTSHDIGNSMALDRGIPWGLQPSKTKELVCEAMVDSLAVLDVLVAIESYRPDNLVLS